MPHLGSHFGRHVGSHFGGSASTPVVVLPTPVLTGTISVTNELDGSLTMQAEHGGTLVVVDDLSGELT